HLDVGRHASAKVLDLLFQGDFDVEDLDLLLQPSGGGNVSDRSIEATVGKRVHGDHYRHPQTDTPDIHLVDGGLDEHGAHVGYGVKRRPFVERGDTGGYRLSYLHVPLYHGAVHGGDDIHALGRGDLPLQRDSALHDDAALGLGGFEILLGRIELHPIVLQLLNRQQTFLVQPLIGLQIFLGVLGTDFRQGQLRSDRRKSLGLVHVRLDTGEDLAALHAIAFLHQKLRDLAG